MRTRSSLRLLSALAVSAVIVACSSSEKPAGSGSPTPSPAADAIQAYLDAVNARCDALLPKIVTATHGGSIDVPAHEYLATWPAHRRLLAAFDADVAKIPVPDAAQRQAAALAAYVRFADHLDADRLTAAHHGQAAYAKEVKAESGAANDPTIAALTAAGFTSSCTAR